MTRKISFKPTGRRSSHASPNQTCPPGTVRVTDPTASRKQLLRWRKFPAPTGGGQHEIGSPASGSCVACAVGPIRFFPVVPVVFTVLVVLLYIRAAAHNLQHGPAPGPEEAHQESGSQQQEDDVENGGVVPLDALLSDLGRPLRRDEAQRAEEELDDVAGDDHGRVEDPEYGQHHLRPVVLPVDDQDRDDDQVGEDERRHAAEADPPIPQHPGQRHVADRADEAEQRDHRADHRPPQPGGQRVAGQEQVPPEAVGHPGADCPGDQESDDDVPDDGSPLHDEDVADRRVPLAADSRRRKLPPDWMLMSIDACPSIDPASPLSACSRAASMSCWRTKIRNATATSTIMMGPPMNSARVNCQEISRARMMPSSTTRLVLAISNTIAAVKLAPLRNSDRASATAAYEHEDDAAP